MSPLPTPFAEVRLESRLKWLMFIRLAVALLCLSAIVVFQGGLRPLSPQPPYFVLTFACVVNLAYLVAVRLGADLRRQAILQLATDVLLVTVLVYLMGPQRLYAALYFAVVIGGAAVMGLRTALSIAAQASLFLGGVAALYYYADAETGLWMVDPEVLKATDTRLSFLVSYSVFYAFGLFAVGLLAGKLSEEVRQVRILNEEILQNMAGGVVAIDRFGEIQFVNSQARRMLGMQNGAVGTEYGRAMPREVALLFKDALSGGERVEKEIMVDGTPLEVSISPLEDGRRARIRGVVAIVNDLSLRSEVEKMTQQASRFRALLEMSAGIAHEIRNPIASIRGAAQELQGVQLPDPDDLKLMDVVMRESDRLDKIITDFLEYASDRPMQPQLCNLAELLPEVVLLLQARDSERNLRIELQVPRTIICRGAPDKLKQVFLNLGVNALEAVEPGGKLTVRCLSATAPEGPSRDGVLVEFEDNGPGISPEHLGRGVDPFFTTKPKGTGMGLAIARKIVDEHGGTIIAENMPGRGAKFRVWLPAD
ncbi:MAG: PAS domain-containing protein [Planctomycetes bacterium]|nr:PAS domain-containing protein [Planctomycetota bacterium]